MCFFLYTICLQNATSLFSSEVVEMRNWRQSACALVWWYCMWTKRVSASCFTWCQEVVCVFWGRVSAAGAFSVLATKLCKEKNFCSTKFIRVLVLGNLFLILCHSLFSLCLSCRFVPFTVSVSFFLSLCVSVSVCLSPPPPSLSLSLSLSLSVKCALGNNNSKASKKKFL